ncbi:Copper chaperone CopZ [Nitrospina gracilis 3/211]|uniref:Copper chaperone CopZ n=1 Tax=Nitrospina gracilis (strain 3/211) TaxID=1266370 RepID=M1Z212_NITG3|nr:MULTISPECIES: copper ion binding protein [Nitrospina]MCF8724384.1 copper ion binding protein [Nitrospina sp. Nb-3]CCQ91539.1 Copper chaperone CopZ [Nitrospina gracilis 3/211]
MAHETLNVDGMTCGHCVETVSKAVSSIPGVSKVDVDLEKKRVTVDFDENQTALADIKSKITDVGYEVVGA